MGDPEHPQEPIKRQLLLAWNPPIPEPSHSLSEPDSSTSEVPVMQPSKPPDYGFFCAVLGLLLAIQLALMAFNGLTINWQLSVLAYICTITGFVWTFLAHAVPHRKRWVKISGSIVIVGLVGWGSVMGVLKQYKTQHSDKALKLELHVNNFPEPITNGCYLKIRKGDSITFQILNIGDIPANNVGVGVSMPLTQESVEANDWQVQSERRKSDWGVLKHQTHWDTARTIAGEMKSQSGAWVTGPITIKSNIQVLAFDSNDIREWGFKGDTNYIPNVYLPVKVDFSADGFTDKRIFLISFTQ